MDEAAHALAPLMYLLANLLPEFASVRVQKLGLCQDFLPVQGQE
jgi:hypothetical protein